MKAPAHTRGARRHPILGAASLAIQSLTLNALSLFATAYIIRRMGTLHYGEWAAAASLASAHLVVTNPGLRTLFVRDVARRPDNAKELLAEQLGLRLVLGALAAASAMSICLLFGYPPIVVACMAVGCVWIILSALWTTLGDLLQSLELFATYSAVGMVSGLVVTASAVLVAYLGYGSVALTVAYLTAPAVNAVLYWNEVSKRVPIGIRWSRFRAIELLRESRLVGFNALSTTIRDRAEQLLVPTLVGLEAFGVFSVGTIAADRLGNIPDAIGTAFYPRISHATAASKVTADAAVLSMLTLGVAVCVPVAILGTFLAPLIAEIMLPGSSETGRALMSVSVWSVPLMALSTGMLYSLQASGHYDLAARAGFLATTVSAGLSLALISTLGLTGAAWSFVARPAILTVMLLLPFLRVFPSVLVAVPFVRILLSASTLGAVCLVADRQRIFPALGYASAGVVAYGLALLGTRVVSASAVRQLLPSAAPE